MIGKEKNSNNRWFRYQTLPNNEGGKQTIVAQL